MSLITDLDYALQAIRLSALRYSDDSVTPRIISLDPEFALNAYVAASGLSDIDRWPEISRALDSPPPESGFSSTDEDGGIARAGPSRRGLSYTQTIMGSKSGGLGMRVAGRRTETKERRANSGTVSRDSLIMSPGKTPKGKLPEVDGFFSPSGRPRSDSAPAIALLEVPSGPPDSMLNSGRGLGASGQVGLLEQALSPSEGSMDYDLESSVLNTGMAMSARPSESVPGLGETMDEVGINSDMDEDQGEDEDPEAARAAEAERRKSLLYNSQRSSLNTDGPPLDFRPQPIAPVVYTSSLTADLHRHVPHLVSDQTQSEESQPPPNPFASLYTSVSARPPQPSLALNVYFPHSQNPTKPLVMTVRKDATVEEVTGYGLFKYWEEGRVPLLSEEEESDQRWSTVGWGLRIVEDDGEVDEDFPPLDRDGQISRFSYGEFAIVEATDSQMKQNTAKAPLIQRRPSRVIAGPARMRPAAAGRPSFNQQASTTSIDTTASIDNANATMKGSVGLSSALSKAVLLRIRVATGADVHYTTTISAPSDMYIADLTDVVVKKKHLPGFSSDWVLCLGDLSLALPLDRTVASLESTTDLALVKRQFAVEHGLRIGDRRGGDPSTSIFKRVSEPLAGQRYGSNLSDFNRPYMQWVVQRKIAIGRHERTLAIDDDHIHIMPSTTRTFFDSTKTTTFHVSLIASCKLTGRAGGFKMNVYRDPKMDFTQKRYEFEADNGKQAAEIVSIIRAQMKLYPLAEKPRMPHAQASVRKKT